MNTVIVAAGMLAVLFAATAVTRENPIYAALYTLLTLAGVAVEFAVCASPFLASMQILLYAGAIMVLFVFVIMLLSLKKEEHGHEPPLASKAVAGGIAFGIFMFLFAAIGTYAGRGDWSSPEQEANLASFAQTGVQFGSADHFGRFLYGSSVVPFELVSVLVTAAVAGVVLLARKHAPTSESIAADAQERWLKAHHQAHESPAPARKVIVIGGGASASSEAHK
jgi:NADH-quinone oxidoreductase subunit J